jgi:phosphatidylserine/phosphatidylglycerophosphate/cardiolipin synthase-like enzyme
MGAQMTLITQPEDGIAPIIRAMDSAQDSLDILIFRFDRKELEHSLISAVGRGVKVRALIAHTNRGGEKSLRSLEMRLLKAGIMVSRTGEDFVRYHGKMLIVDKKELYLLGFNFTYLDIDRSRSFGIALKDRKLIAEAQRLFDADCARQPFESNSDEFLVSPVNARRALAEFLKGAEKELLLYDPNLGDEAMAAILRERGESGITVRVLGCSTRTPYRKLKMRLHVRLILRDGKSFFLGSQSLRASELDKRREIGVIIDDPKLCGQLKKTFEADWESAEGPAEGEAVVPASRIAKTVAKAVTKEIPPLLPIVTEAIKDAGGDSLNLPVSAEDLQANVSEAVKQVVKEVVRDAVEGNT